MFYPQAINPAIITPVISEMARLALGDYWLLGPDLVGPTRLPSAFDRKVLADALTDAGCNFEEFLAWLYREPDKVLEDHWFGYRQILTHIITIDTDPDVRQHLENEWGIAALRVREQQIVADLLAHIQALHKQLTGQTVEKLRTEAMWFYSQRQNSKAYSRRYRADLIENNPGYIHACEVSDLTGIIPSGVIWWRKAKSGRHARSSQVRRGPELSIEELLILLEKAE